MGNGARMMTVQALQGAANDVRIMDYISKAMYQRENTAKNLAWPPNDQGEIALWRTRASSAILAVRDIIKKGKIDEG
jgi:hypothetical protein